MLYFPFIIRLFYLSFVSQLYFLLSVQYFDLLYRAQTRYINTNNSFDLVLLFFQQGLALPKLSYSKAHCKEIFFMAETFLCD